MGNHILDKNKKQVKLQRASRETVLSDAEAVNGGFPVSEVIQIQVKNAIYDYRYD